MASQKTELKKHLLYLQSRRSGAEKCLDLVTCDADKEVIRTFIHSMGTSVQDTSSKIAEIENEEARIKEAEKAEKEEQRKNRQRGL